jgi:hypothetical protein
MAEHSVVLFHSSAHAIRAEKVLVKAGFRIKMIPTPRHISSNCGMALRLARGEEQQVAEVLNEKRVPINGIHEV